LSDHHEVTLFEREETLGGHAHTVDAPGGDADYPVDTGFLVYNEVTYPKFIALLERLGVRSRESSMSFSYQDVRSGLEWKGSSLNTIFAQRRNILRRASCAWWWTSCPLIEPCAACSKTPLAQRSRWRTS